MEMKTKKLLSGVLLLSLIAITICLVPNQVLADFEAVVETDDNAYEEMQEAIDDVADGGSVTIRSILDISKGFADGFEITGNKNITWDLKGNTYNIAGKPNSIKIEKGSTLVIKNGTLKSENNEIVEEYSDSYGASSCTGKFIENYGTLTLENVKIEATTASDVIYSSFGTVNISENTSITAGNNNNAIKVDDNNANYEERTIVTVNTTGTINGNIEFAATETGISNSLLDLIKGKLIGKITDGDNAKEEKVTVWEAFTIEEPASTPSQTPTQSQTPDSSPSNAEVTNKDNTSNIKLETTSNVVPGNTVLNVTSIEAGDIYNNVKKALTGINKFVLFDISLMSNDAKVQPNGNVKISIPVPSGYDISKLIVYKVDTDGNKTEYKVNVTTEDNIKYAQFETDHFSYYVLAEQPTNKKLDNEPKTGVSNYAIFASAITLILLAGIVIIVTLKIKKNHQ